MAVLSRPIKKAKSSLTILGSDSSMAHLAKAGRVRSALYLMLWKPVIVS